MHTLATTDLEILRLIPDSQYRDFVSLSEKIQSSIIIRLRWIHSILHAPHGHKSPIVAAAAAELGVEPCSIHRYLRAFKRRGWRGLIDTRKTTTASKGLHPKFKSYVAGLFDAHQRDNDDGAEVWRTIKDRWNQWRRTGDPQFAIPGYDHPPAPTPTGLPHGWSYDNILRLRNSKSERAATKHGAKEATKFLPPVLTTRVGSAVLSRVLFDDQDLDNMLADGVLAIAGLTDAMRPVSFNSLDFYTAAHLDNHLRAVAKDPTSGKNKTLTGKEFAWFVIKHLQQFGYRTDELGTELIFEHGTANCWKSEAKIKTLTTFAGLHSFDDALEAVTRGNCRVNRSGKFNKPIFADLHFRPSSTGNFKFKTWIESAFRLLRTYMQALPGPTGSHARINGKDELHGIKIEERKLLTAISEIVDPYTQEIIARSFEHELLDLQTFHALIQAVYRAINARTKHNLEGWAQCGFTLPLWRPTPTSDTWFDQSELPSDPEERMYLMRRINANRDVLTTVESLAPASALELEIKRDREKITRLADPLVGLLLPSEWAISKPVGDNHTLKLPNPLWPDTLDSYVCSWIEKDMRVTLDHGKKLRIFHNPFFDGRAQIHDENGAYITTLYPTVRAEPFSPEKTLLQLQSRSAIQSGHQAHLRARMEDIGTTRQEKRQINRDLLALTREDRRRIQKKKDDQIAEQRAAELPTGDAGEIVTRRARRDTEIPF